MAALITLEEDGPLGPAGTQVWVDDPKDAADKPLKAATAKKAAAAKDSDD